MYWQPKVCIHSEKCWRGLPQVFKPRDKPWIDVNGASTEIIKKQIDQCPSRALSYDKTTTEMSKTDIQVLKNGPLMIKGEVEIAHNDGRKEQKSNAAFCRCGHSTNKPFCDGSHKKEGFEG